MLQSLALRLYRSAIVQALMNFGIGEQVFQRTYFLYKQLFEAREVAHLRQYIDRNGWIVDVGANIGFHTVTFARWLKDGKVLAIEPEPNNFRRLTAVIAARSLVDRVEARQIAVAERKALGHLILSSESHADHRLGDSGQPVAVDTLDAIWTELRQPEVRLIKIDVQGAEARVLRGAQHLLTTCQPALYVEVDTDPIRLPRDHASALLGGLDALGYRPHTWRDGRWTPVTPNEAIAEAEGAAARYADFLFLHSQAPNHSIAQ